VELDDDAPAAVFDAARRDRNAPRHLEVMPEPETTALDLTCAECGRSPRAGETWRVVFADNGEAVTYCPECAVSTAVRSRTRSSMLLTIRRFRRLRTTCY
jgi:ribosomal protein L44E